ncbi:RNA polymerase sigma factor [Mesorhizobium sp. B3-1-3]|uniref:RNA polymerase sigma factor n=1 Tax=unclassified Mesorhizobium TaxID=325217 RepID=UPI001129C6EA|nr:MULTISPECIES: RNA polymerase sigma factor [unclassified Mesorhizobium]TPI52713.1 RNA polymerase sigma factor [Mesorhizobium sp. B3-1-8]TPI62899.1 RNA polymerase sigma factor [Mesorhizobium sp. B3-1-3]
MRQPAIEAAEIGAARAGDMALVRRALARDPGAFRTIIKTHNQRLYRIARGVVRNDAEAEDVVQEAYIRAFANLGAFRGEASLSTWLSRIVINEALGRLRKRKRVVAMPENPEAQIIRFPLNQNDLNPGDDPERTMAQRQILGLVERATDSLPDVYRTVFVARVIEGLSIEETAELLGIRQETVKTRLHRARALVRKALDDEIGPVLLNAFPFAGRRCDRLTQAVMTGLGFEH